MSSGWGCQYLTKIEDESEWCIRLKHKCKPGCSGCVLYGRFIFSNQDIMELDREDREVKRRDDRPLNSF